MTAQVETRRESGAAIMEQVIIKGNLADLTPEERVTYYLRVCDSLGLNPLTKPFDYIMLNGKLTLYAKKDATDQLRAKHGVSVFIVRQERMDDLYVVTAEASDRVRRRDTEIGAVAIGGLKGDALANAVMKAVTKAKRRVTLSIVGLGVLDETELETIPNATAAPRFSDELDALSGGVPSSASGAPDQPYLISDAQMKKLWATVREQGWSEAQLYGCAREIAGAAPDATFSLHGLSVSQASALIGRVAAGPVWTDVDAGGEAPRHDPALLWNEYQARLCHAQTPQDLRELREWITRVDMADDDEWRASFLARRAELAAARHADEMAQAELTATA